MPIYLCVNLNKKNNEQSKGTKGSYIALTVLSTSCNNSSKQLNSETKMELTETNTTVLPTVDKFVTSPLRNKLILALNQPISEVWKTIGDPAQMPTYSAGLNKVDTKTEGEEYTEYTCHFKPMEDGGKETVHTAKMLWRETDKGWASLDNEPNEFGFKQSLTLITMQQKGDKTIVNWAMHYNCDTDEMLQMNRTSLEQALTDIGNQLTAKFGGSILENYIQK
jgi:carbon monoxide dehydrogenase subunit G